MELNPVIKYRWSRWSADNRRPVRLPSWINPDFLLIPLAILFALVMGYIAARIEIVSPAEAAPQVTNSEAAYTRALEKMLATCLKGGDNPLTIGGELWLCGASRTGVKVFAHPQL